MQMPMVALGKTGMQVSRLSLGGLFFGKLANGRDCAPTLREAVNLGINFIDTAIAYSGSEEALGNALSAKHLHKYFQIASKWWPYLAGNKLDLRPESLRNAVEGSLKRLQRDHLDLFLFHSISFEGNITELTEGPLWPELMKLKAEGKIKHIGISNEGKLDPEDSRLIEASESGQFDVVMPEFLAFRQIARKKLLPLCQKNNTGVIGITPLGQAAWGKGLRNEGTLKASLLAMATAAQIPPDPDFQKQALDLLMQGNGVAETALRYCFSVPGISTVCCGTNNPEHLKQNAAVAAMEPLPQEFMEQAEKLFGGIKNHHV